MSADNQNMDLGLALGYSNNCTRPKMNVNSGAGVNAGSSVNLKFPASDSLSELVWSPHKGLSLKCAEGGLADKKPFLLWNVGPSNVDPSPSLRVGCTGIDDDKIVAGNLVIHQLELHLDSEAAERANLIESPKNSTMPTVGSGHERKLESKNELEGRKIEEGFLTKSGIQIAHHLGGNEKEECDLLKEQMDDMPESSKNDTGQLIPNLSLQGPPDSICDMAKAEALSENLIKDIPIDLNFASDNAVIGCQIMEEGTAATQVNIQIQSEAHNNPLCLDVSTKEAKGANEEERKNKFSTHGYRGPAVEKLEYTAENDLPHMTVKDAYQQSEERLVRGSSVPLETNAENHSSHFHQLEDKDKALSEGDVSRRFSDAEDDSQETVESCNSACVLVKRRWNFSEQLKVGSKRMKKNINGNIASTSIIKRDSSFMNWISNMVTGFSKSNHEDGLSLDLTLAHSCHEDTSIIQENVTCSRLQEPISRNAGFQTIFQSLYRPNTKPLEAGTLENDCSAQGLQDFMQVDKTDIQISPNSFSEQNGVSCHEKLTLDEKILGSATEDIGGQSDQSLILTAISPIQNDSKTDSTENKYLSNKECCKDKGGASASVYLADHGITTTENGNPQIASDGRAALSNKGNLRGSSWITRFKTKVCSTSLNLSKSNKDDSQVIWYPDDFRMPNPQTQNSSEFPDGEKYPDNGVRFNKNSGDSGKESQAFAANAESSLGSKEIQENNHYQNAEPLFRTSEAMASTFARRLDAFKHKHIRPTVLENDASSQMPYCFFCGKSGHNLQACSKVTETGLVDPLRNKHNSCFVDEEDNVRVAACDGEIDFTNTSDENPMSNGKKLLGNRSSGLNQNNSNSLENKTREHQTLPLISMVMMNSAEVPKGVFDAVRRLQLSRADMLKWINSNVSLSHLEGLFLRLRLGKWEAGLGGTGYYVACITVEQSGEPLKDCKKSISVNVGGMKCLVGSQYISNHDFLEDELMVWWCRILKSGGKVPSKEDLESKFKQRITLGF